MKTQNVTTYTLRAGKGLRAPVVKIIAESRDEAFAMARKQTGAADVFFMSAHVTEFTTYDLEDKVMCPQCHAFAVVPLTPQQLAAQPDNTSHVCHPAFGGCNQGFGA